MLKVYNIEDGVSYSQVHSVVAESFGDAERIFKNAYKQAKIKSIKLHSEYVLIDEVGKTVELVRRNA